MVLKSLHCKLDSSASKDAIFYNEKEGYLTLGGVVLGV